MPSRRVKHFLIALVATMVTAVGVSLLATATASTNFYYSVIELGAVKPSLSYGPVTTHAYSINDLGQAVGESTVPLGTLSYSIAILWTKDGKITVLDSPSSAYSINNVGQVVGRSAPPPRYFMVPKALLWQNGQTTLLSTSSSAAYSINNAGQIVGYVGSSSIEPRHAVLWNGGQMIDLGTLNGYPNSQANDINDAGQVVGNSYQYVSSGTTSSVLARPVLWQNGTITDLGTLGGTLGSANSINNAGQIVGGSETSNGQYHAFLRQNGSMADLGTLGGNNSSATSINNSGTIVGSSDTSTGETHAFVWYQGRMIDLNSLLPPNSGWVLTYGTEINNKGVIVGTGKHNGLDRGFLLR
jgi:probable HAF family extracellular repeat protein